MKSYSWGNFFKNPQKIKRFDSKDVVALSATGTTILPYGNGRSYGDSCLNSNGILLDMSSANKFISFNPKTGVLCCEAGVLLLDILETFTPQGWTLPTTPGTAYVSVGGAIANDVHGKNHHKVGSFGHFVKALTLLRTDGTTLICSETENADYFKATIAGLGLTGIILQAEIQLVKMDNAYIKQTTRPMKNVEHFLKLSEDALLREDDYIVAWVDYTAEGENLGQGVFITGNPVNIANTPSLKVKFNKPSYFSIPFTPPFSLINKWSITAFNWLYMFKNARSKNTRNVHFYPFFYPLDGLKNWNRLYGTQGFVQYQCVFPLENAKEILKNILTTIQKSQQGSFLTVLKVMGDKEGAGILSFSRRGVTFAIDFPFHMKETTLLLEKLDAIVMHAGGAIYPAKDSRMSKNVFQQSFKNWKDILQYKDPNISSDFWRRVTGETYEEK